MLYTENPTMCHYVGFSNIGFLISKISRFHGSLYEISASCLHWHFTCYVLDLIIAVSNSYYVESVVDASSTSKLNWHKQATFSRLHATGYSLLYLKQVMSSLAISSTCHFLWFLLSVLFRCIE